ncbi:hypothetical protein F5051DRAFT_419108 [Lentinula edodes]|nr:hypothetical protein F5051DRAFT_419108 [Lentinula edodes]
MLMVPFLSFFPSFLPPFLPSSLPLPSFLSSFLHPLINSTTYNSSTYQLITFCTPDRGNNINSSFVHKPLQNPPHPLEDEASSLLLREGQQGQQGQAQERQEQQQQSEQSELEALRRERDTWIKEKQNLQDELQKTIAESASALAAKDVLYAELRVEFEQKTHSLEEEKHSLEQEKQSLEQQNLSLSAQTHSLESQTHSLQSTLLTTQSDRDFFHTQYTTASSYTTSIHSENLLLLQRAEIAESQSTRGVAEVKEMYGERLRRAEEEVRAFSRVVDFMMRKDEKTEGVRREAGEAPELRARCGELEDRIGQLEREREREREEREDKVVLLEGEVGRLEGEVGRLEDKIIHLETEKEEREEQWRREVGKIKQRIGIGIGIGGGMEGDGLIHYHDHERERERDYIPGDPATSASAAPVDSAAGPGPASSGPSPAPGPAGPSSTPAPAPPSTSNPDPNQKVFRCEWREDDGPCLFVCETRKELENHMIHGGHI